MEAHRVFRFSSAAVTDRLKDPLMGKGGLFIFCPVDGARVCFDTACDDGDQVGHDSVVCAGGDCGMEGTVLHCKIAAVIYGCLHSEKGFSQGPEILLCTVFRRKRGDAGLQQETDLHEIRKVRLSAPAAAGSIIIKELLGLGTDVIVTKNVAAAG